MIDILYLFKVRIIFEQNILTQCEYEEYMSTKTNQWAGINGKSKFGLCYKYLEILNSDENSVVLIF